MFAAITDSGDSNNNSATSDVFTGVRALQLALATPKNDTCDGGVNWTDGDIGPATVGSADLNEGTLTLTTNQRVCVRVKRGGPYRLHVGLFNVVDSETGCSTIGIQPEHGTDATCGGGVGELSSILQVRMSTTSTDRSCVTSLLWSFENMVDHANNAGPDLCASVSTGVVYSVLPELLVSPGATNDQLIAAQSDKVQFSYLFSLQR
jgi:hypothetical protein